jgi:hypothetical protein
VAQALFVAHDVRNEWDAFDLELPSGLRIEVKSAPFIFKRGPKELRPKSVSLFRLTRAWTSETNTFAPERERRRQADIYIFAVLHHRSKETLDPLDVTQWEFMLLPTTTLDVGIGKRKRLSLASLLCLSPARCGYHELRASVAQLEQVGRLNAAGRAQR